MRSETIPGIIESKKIYCIFPPNNSKIKNAKNGPIIAPIWSNVLWIPNAFPVLDSSTESAINASRGAVLIPLPILSATLTVIVSINEVTKIKNGLLIVDIPYPIITRIFRFPILSEIYPEGILKI